MALTDSVRGDVFDSVAPCGVQQDNRDQRKRWTAHREERTT